MIAFKSVTVLNEFKKKYPDPIKVPNEFDEMREDLPGLIKASGMNRSEIAKAVGLKETTFFTRMSNPMLWKSAEIRKLLKLFDLI